MQAIILAGGLGTRLQAVVKDVPKPMADINGKPFLAHLLQYLQQYGFTDCCISTGYLQEKISTYFGDKYLGINVSYATEDRPLGTGGAIINSLKNCNKSAPIVVLNGDTFLKVDYKKLLEFHRTNNSQLTMVLRKMDDCSRYGAVEIDKNNCVISFKEKSSTSFEGLINGGVYVIDPQIFSADNLPKQFSFEQDFLIQNLSNLQPYGFVADDYFIDIGIPEDYKRAQIELLPQILSPKITKNKALFLDRDGVINIDHGHVFEKEEFHFVGGIFDLCKRAQDLGYLIIVVTNQAGIAKGFYSEEQFLELTKWMEEEFVNRGIKISKTFYCPYHVEAKIEKYRKDSEDRKPNSGMLLKAIEEFNIDAKKSIMIGDKESDIEAASGANVGLKLLFNGEDLSKLAVFS
jgi:D,D-heptose 1,7-bisphosphate phosphatase